MSQIQSRSSQSTAYALMAGVNAAVLGVLGSGVVLVSETALLLVLGVGLAVVDPLVSVFTAIFFVGVALIVHRTLATWAASLGATTARAEVASLSSIQELIHTYRELTVTGRSANYAGRFEALRGTASAAQAGTQLVNLVPKYVFEIALVVGAGILAASQLFTRDVPAAVAIIAVYLTAASRVMPSMLRLQSSLIVIRGSAAVAASTYELVEQVQWDPQDDPPGLEGRRQDQDSRWGQIRCRRVWRLQSSCQPPRCDVCIRRRDIPGIEGCLAGSAQWHIAGDRWLNRGGQVDPRGRGDGYLARRLRDCADQWPGARGGDSSVAGSHRLCAPGRRHRRGHRPLERRPGLGR